MSESSTDAAKPRTAVAEPAAGRRSRAEGHRGADGIMITRWNLSLSLTLALTVVMGAFSLLWERTNALHATQLELVTRVTRLEVQVTALQEDVTVIREDVTALREELHESVADLREEFRAEIAGLREELREDIRELGDLIRAREMPEVGAQ